MIPKSQLNYYIPGIVESTRYLMAKENKKPATYCFVDPPGETVLGDSLEIDIECVDGIISPLDWIGIYPSNVPSLPGLSHNRWKYLSPFIHNTNKGAIEDRVATEQDPIRFRVVFDAASLPNHSGTQNHIILSYLLTI